MIGIFDIGSNTVRVGVFSQTATADLGGATALYKKLVTTRLGEGLLTGTSLSEQAMERSIRAIRTLSEETGVTERYGFATAAVRRADNGKEFLDRVLRETGVKTELLSGETEAETGIRGALGKSEGGIVDIGGASSEIALQRKEKGALRICYRHSVNLGCVLLKNACEEDAEAITRMAEEKVKEFVSPVNLPLVGIGGTATALAGFDLGLKTYDPAKVTGHFVSTERLDVLAKKLQKMSLAEREAEGIPAGRSDLILQGALLMKSILLRVGAEGYTASDRDNIEGYALTLSERSL